MAQGAGATSSGILMGDHASLAWAPILGATGTYLLGAGGLWHHQDQTPGGLATVGTDVIKTVNQDSGHIATVRITAFGLK